MIMLNMVCSWRRDTNHVKTPNPITTLLTPQAPLHLFVALYEAWHINPDIQRIANIKSQKANAYGCANFRVRGNRNVIVKYIRAGIVRKT